MMIETDRKTSASVTGHRTIFPLFDRTALQNTLENVIKRGFCSFFVGMAVGFDTECFHALERLREKYPIKIIACVPCIGQSQRFSEFQKRDYQRMIKTADETVILEEKYTSNCMRKRNEFMVDHSSLVIAYLKKKGGGTYNTIKYAVENNVRVEYFL